MIVVSVFLVGSYPPAVWAAVVALSIFPPFAALPLAALAGLSLTLRGLWKPTMGGWVGAAVFFGFGLSVSLVCLGMELSKGWRHQAALLAAAGVAHYALAMFSLLAMKRRWDAWEERLRRVDGWTA